jgi:hypothetical protein
MRQRIKGFFDQDCYHPGYSRAMSRPRQGVFGKPGKLFERERVLAGLSKNILAWP